jgi:hypothetical protein
MLEALREKRIAKSSALFQNLAESVGLQGCLDTAFIKPRACALAPIACTAQRFHGNGSVGTLSVGRRAVRRASSPAREAYESGVESGYGYRAVSPVLRGGPRILAVEVRAGLDYPNHPALERPRLIGTPS